MIGKEELWDTLMSYIDELDSGSDPTELCEDLIDELQLIIRLADEASNAN